MIELSGRTPGGVSDEQIDAFLALFEGGPNAAIAALEARRARIDSRAIWSHKQPMPSSALQPPRTDTPIISIKDISKQYKVGKQRIDALKGVTLDIYKGEFVAIIGPSGSGKSTLLQMIGCLDKPTSGTVLVDGQNTSKLRDGKLSLLRRSAIGFIFQSFYLQPFLRLNDNVAVPAMFTGKKRSDINNDTSKLLEKVGISDRSKHFPKELSGGQVQRAAIARALINQPKIILADEPTGNLDSANSKGIVNLFKAVRDQLGTTIVVVTHNPDIAAQADRVVTLSDGAIV